MVMHGRPKRKGTARIRRREGVHRATSPRPGTAIAGTGPPVEDGALGGARHCPTMRTPTPVPSAAGACAGTEGVHGGALADTTGPPRRRPGGERTGRETRRGRRCGRGNLRDRTVGGIRPRASAPRPT